jgi:anti-sigma regulatory factor (Ser/Thr protein kinase)
MTGDQITLTLPRERRFFGVAHLVVGGLAARLDLSYAELDDLQVALTELLGYRETDGSVTVTVRVDERSLEASVGPFDAALVAELQRDSGHEVGLRRVLNTVVDEVDVTDREGAPWVALRKSIHSGVAS